MCHCVYEKETRDNNGKRKKRAVFLGTASRKNDSVLEVVLDIAACAPHVHPEHA